MRGYEIPSEWSFRDLFKDYKQDENLKNRGYFCRGFLFKYTGYLRLHIHPFYLGNRVFYKNTFQTKIVGF